MKRATRGEIVQVEGGHVLRSTGRKDRHSKVYTAKGPRDRRVRLSAHTAIQFYDVQDRLGYDRPSKAVDWLIKKAKNAIDKLAELPPWNPNEDVANNLPTSDETHVDSTGNIALEPHEPLSNSSRLLFQRQVAENLSSSSSYMMPESVAESQFVGDTSKSFFPMNSGTSLTNFPSFSHDIVMSRDSIQADDHDLGLSLHTNLHDQNSNHSPNNPALSFEATYDNNNNPRIGNWIIPHQPFFSQRATYSQIREPLQSNFSQLIHHAWEQRLMASEVHQSSISNIHFNGDFQFHGEEVNGVVCTKPSCGSSRSHY